MARKKKLNDDTLKSFVSTEKYGNGLTADNMNRKDLDAIIEMSSWPLIDLNDPEALMTRFKEYLEFCYDHDCHITNMAAYNAIGVTRTEFNHWLQGDKTKMHKTFAEYVNRVCASYRELKMANGQIMPVVGIWWQKNFDEFQDKPHELKHDVGRLEVRTPEQIAASLPKLDAPKGNDDGQ